MTQQNIIGFFILLIISIGASLLVYALVKKHLRSLLDKVIRIKAGTAFYIRVFLIGIVFIALSAALNVEFSLKKGAVVMEYVWKIADGLSTVFGQTTLYIFGYLILVTILIVGLRKKHGK
jgi:hypothetical protein